MKHPFSSSLAVIVLIFSFATTQAADTSCSRGLSSQVQDTRDCETHAAVVMGVRIPAAMAPHRSDCAPRGTSVKNAWPTAERDTRLETGSCPRFLDSLSWDAYDQAMLATKSFDTVAILGSSMDDADVIFTSEECGSLFDAPDNISVGIVDASSNVTLCSVSAPEPSALFLLSAGIMGFAFIRKRKTAC